GFGAASVHPTGPLPEHTLRFRSRRGKPPVRVRPGGLDGRRTEGVRRFGPCPTASQTLTTVQRRTPRKCQTCGGLRGGQGRGRTGDRRILGRSLPCRLPGGRLKKTGRAGRACTRELPTNPLPRRLRLGTGRSSGRSAGAGAASFGAPFARPL